MGLKKISVKFIAKEEFDKKIISENISVVQVDDYEEIHIKHDDFLSNYTFEFLKDSGMQFGKGIWLTIKGFAGMAGWAVIAIVEAFRFLWKKIQ